MTREGNDGPSTLMRSWSARVRAEGEESYGRHFSDHVLPRLQGIPGHRGALLLRRPEGAGAELVVLTFWESMDAIRAFAGANPTRAVVEPEARDVLQDYDKETRIFEVLMDTRA